MKPYTGLAAKALRRDKKGVNPNVSSLLTIKYMVIGIIVITLLMSGIAAASPVKAGEGDCNIEPDHEYCNGTRGANGMAFCDVAGVDRGDDCYDRDFSRIDCDESPNHSRCSGFQGRTGLIFCDVQYQDVGYKHNCYDRNDDPKEYCDNYAIDESDREWTAWFCQVICDNYQEVIGRGEPCEN